MKKTLFFASLSLVSFAGSAQFYFAPVAGYSIPVMKHFIVQDYANGLNSYNHNGMYGSFGGGTVFGGTVGHKHPNQGWLLEFSFESFSGNEVKSEFGNTDSTASQMNYVRTIAIKGMNLIPKIGYSVTRGAFTFAFTNGIIVGTHLKAKTFYSEKGVNWDQEIEEKEFGNMALGLRSSLSFRYNFFKGLYAALDLLGNFQSWRPERGEATRNDFNGVDQLALYNYNYTQFVFVENYTLPNPSIGPGDPFERLAKVYSLSGVGAQISIGLQFFCYTKSGKRI